MAKSLSKLLAEADDCELINRVCSLICKVYGDQPDVEEMPEPARVIFLVWGAYGIIGNGGFNFLFECVVAGDPDFSLTAEAYETIGCEQAAKAFRRALDMFPSGVPEDRAERLQIFRRGTGEERHEIDVQFFGASKQIEATVAAYIRKHGEEFKRLEKSKRRREKKKLHAAATEERATDPVAVGIVDLPHWARVAFAARCARMVYPFFDEFWPDAIHKRVAAVNNAIRLAAQAATMGEATEGVENAASEALQAAGAALAISLYGYKFDDPEPGPPDGNAASRVSYVIKAAEFAATAATAEPKESADHALASYAYAREISEGMDPDMYDRMAFDFRILLRAARRGRWNDRTPVPQSVFASNEDDQDPKKPWWKFW